MFEPLLQPLPKPSTVPKHPVRDLTERCQKAGLAVSVDAVPGGRGAIAWVDHRNLARYSSFMLIS